MSKISIIATLTAAEGKADDLVAGLRALIEAADEEPGLEIYSLHQDPKNPDTLYFFEVYSDEEAFAVHGKGEKMAAAMGALGGLLGGRPDVKVLSPLAAKGLDI
jgi:quinol monooxygenase YgiN